MVNEERQVLAMTSQCSQLLLDSRTSVRRRETLCAGVRCRQRGGGYVSIVNTFSVALVSLYLHCATGSR